MIRYKKNPVSRQSKSVIQVDGREYQAKYIGKGQYSKVFRVGDRVVFYTRGDCSKEVLAMFQHERMTHLPEIVRHENITTPRGTWYVFSSPFYRNVRKSDASAYALRDKIKKWYGVFYRQYPGNDIHTMQAIVDDFRKSQIVPHSVIKALQEIVNVVSNCSANAGFDFQNSNFGVNEYGTLIFRDPVWVRS